MRPLPTRFGKYDQNGQSISAGLPAAAPSPCGRTHRATPRAERLFKSRLRAPEKEATAWDLYCTRGAVTWAMGVPQLGCRPAGWMGH